MLAGGVEHVEVVRVSGVFGVVARGGVSARGDVAVGGGVAVARTASIQFF